MKKFLEPALVLFLSVAIIATFGFFIMMSPEMPASQRVAKVAATPPPSTTMTVINVDGTTTVVADRYPSLGQKQIYQPLIPMPTPTPTPTPTPKVYPKIDAMLKGWKLAGIGSNNKKIDIESDQTIFEFALGDIKEVELNNLTLPVRLDEIDGNNYQVKFKAPETEVDKEWLQELTLKF